MFNILYDFCTDIKIFVKDYFYPKKTLEESSNISPEILGKIVMVHLRQMNNNYLY